MNAERLGAMLAAIEEILPTPRLVWRIDDEGNIHEVANPASWLMERVAADETALICNGDEHQLVSLAVNDMVRDLQRGRLFHLGVRVTRCTRPMSDRAFALIERLGVGASAFEGEGTPGAAAVTIRDHYVGDEAAELPLAHPGLIGWVNYWSAEACRLVGLTADDARRALFARLAACEGGGVALQLTETPLDLTDPAHRAALEAAWDAFPTIPRKPGRPRAEA